MKEKKKCLHCGDCCSSLLPITESELEKLKQLAKENPIVKKKDGLDCPFLSCTNSCLIYKDRPEICRIYHCNKNKRKGFSGKFTDYKPVNLNNVLWGDM